MDKQPIGNDLSKWYITKRHGRWSVCPPITDDPDWSEGGDAFATGAEAHAAFAGRRKS